MVLSGLTAALLFAAVILPRHAASAKAGTPPVVQPLVPAMTANAECKGEAKTVRHPRLPYDPLKMLLRGIVI